MTNKTYAMTNKNWCGGPTHRGETAMNGARSFVGAGGVGRGFGREHGYFTNRGARALRSSAAMVI